MKHIFKIQFLLLIIMTLSSCSIIGLVQSHQKVKGDYAVELKPVDKDPVYDMSINVIQGIAAFEKGWFTSQTSKGKFLLINYLNEKGESEFHKRLFVDSHGQDLSLEQMSPNKLRLFTTVGHYNEAGASHLLSIIVDLPAAVNGQRDMTKIQVKIEQTYPLDFTNSTPTLSEDKQYFAIRSGSSIMVASKENVLKGDWSKAKMFDLDPTQLMDGNTALWFQGIAMKGDFIYCMTGNNSLGSPKYLYVYDKAGVVVEKHTIDKNEFAKQLKKKLEPEGITFKDGVLYYTIMLKGGTGGNRKFLFELKN